jgi:hypothetical protein
MMLAKLRRMAWQDWAVPIQILLGLSLLAIALAQAPHEEALGRTGPNAACIVTAGCGAEAQ